MKRIETNNKKRWRHLPKSNLRWCQCETVFQRSQSFLIFGIWYYRVTHPSWRSVNCEFVFVRIRPWSRASRILHGAHTKRTRDVLVKSSHAAQVFGVCELSSAERTRYSCGKGSGMRGRGLESVRCFEQADIVVPLILAPLPADYLLSVYV
jgi:hypothetical protein